MFDRFSHYLSYGATDQTTVRDLAGSFNGLLVPGTVAAFQRDGTGGFVLTLSASVAATPYVIDPRFPLFQQALAAPKQSHRALAELLQAPQLIRTVDPAPSDFHPALIESVAEGWIGFNTGYTTQASAKFAKYAKRLGEAVQPSDATGPAYILPPYMVCDGISDGWWRVSQDFFTASVALRPAVPCIRVVAASDARHLDEMLETVQERRVVVWVSRLDELERDALALAVYGRAISRASERGQETFALYGGFFAVLLAAVGLSGASHGIGYGESRAWIELPQSGPPPARYYLPHLHRYVNQEFAYQLWLRDRRLAECPCPECEGEPPIALDYHALMKHSVHCRAAEIEQWTGLDLAGATERLDDEFGVFAARIDSASLPGVIRRQADRAMDHVPRWRTALDELANP